MKNSNLNSIAHAAGRGGGESSNIKDSVNKLVSQSYVTTMASMGLGSIFSANQNLFSGIEKLSIFGTIGGDLKSIGNIFGSSIDNVLKMPTINKGKGRNGR